jgi:hypothetical protein
VFEDLLGSDAQASLSAAKTLINLDAKSVHENTYDTPSGSVISTWDVYEAAYTSALMLGDEAAASKAIKALKLRFPKSRRVRRLINMFREGKEPMVALEEYKKMRDEDPTDFVREFFNFLLGVNF